MKQIKLHVAKVINGRKFYTREELFIPDAEPAVSTRDGAGQFSVIMVQCLLTQNIVAAWGPR